MESMCQAIRNKVRFLFLALYFASSMNLRAWANDDIAVPESNPKNILNERIEEERRWRKQGIVLIPHHFNYFLPYTYNTSPNTTPSDTDISHLDHAEAKYQLSFKVLVWDNLFDQRAHLYVAYTQLAMWQFYNNAASAPFRDTNYQPEAIMTWDTNMVIDGWRMSRIDYALNHQSNGRSVPLSRSWNRAMATAYLTKGPFGLTINPWLRFPEKKSRDDNSDIEQYMGHGEITFSYSYRRQLLNLMIRDNISLANNKGAYQLDYTFPLTRVLRGLIQYFYGYGECLLDYNSKNNRLGIGLALSEWK